ncbi:hypothetical protein ZWY2020_017781 [Hordeum vulgare]|nr:hypothetical protein ZWY2020_017781 [Hordeum vulgare]
MDDVAGAPNWSDKGNDLLSDVAREVTRRKGKRSEAMEEVSVARATNPRLRYLDDLVRELDGDVESLDMSKSRVLGIRATMARPRTCVGYSRVTFRMSTPTPTRRGISGGTACGSCRWRRPTSSGIWRRTYWAASSPTWRGISSEYRCGMAVVPAWLEWSGGGGVRQQEMRLLEWSSSLG